MNAPTHAVRITFLCVPMLAACSVSPPPSRVFPDCGAPVEETAVQVLDLRGLGLEGDGLAEYVTSRVGSYRLFTQEPIAVGKGPRKRARFDPALREQPESPEGIGRSISEAAERGCDLVLVIGALSVPPSVGEAGSRTGNYSERWLVHMGQNAD